MVEITRAAAGLPAEADPYTVASAIDDYIAALEQEGRSDQATSGVRTTADAHIVPKLGTIWLDRLRSKQIKEWLYGLAKAPPRLRVATGQKQRHRIVDMTDVEVRRRRRSSANRVLGVLKAALNLAWRNDKVANDKAWRAVKPYAGADASRSRYLTTSECLRLINSSPGDFRELVRAALHTGARYSELCRLTATDFNPDSGTVAVKVSKTGKPRHVVLTEEGIDFFRQATMFANNRKILFTRRDGAPWRKSWQVRPMKAACAAANITPAIGFHILRHTWASLTVMGGAPLLVVARNLGHATTRMVEQHYGHLAPSYEAEAIRAAAPTFGEAPMDKVRLIRPKLL